MLVYFQCMAITKMQYNKTVYSVKSTCSHSTISFTFLLSFLLFRFEDGMKLSLWAEAEY